jgi:hypothetical protein
MKNTIFIALFSLLIVGSCTNAKNGTTTENVDSAIKITNVTMQEMVAGVQGGKSTFRFFMNIETGSKTIVPDSLTFGTMKAKLFLKNESENLYSAKAVDKSGPQELKVSNEKMVVVSFNADGKKIVVRADSVKVLDKMYLP